MAKPCNKCSAIAKSSPPDIPPDWIRVDTIDGTPAASWVKNAPVAECPVCGCIWFAMPNPRDGFDEISGPLDDRARSMLRADSDLSHIAPLLKRGTRDMEFTLRDWFSNQDYDEAEATAVLLEALSAPGLDTTRARLITGYLSTVVTRDREPDPSVTLDVSPLVQLFDRQIWQQDAAGEKHRARGFAVQAANRIAHGRVPFTVVGRGVQMLQDRYGPRALRKIPLDLIEKGLRSGGENALAWFHEAWHPLHEQALSTVEGLNTHEFRAVALAYQRLRSLSGLPVELKQELEGVRAIYRHLLEDVVAYGSLSNEDKEAGKIALDGGKLPFNTIRRAPAKKKTAAPVTAPADEHALRNDGAGMPAPEHEVRELPASDRTVDVRLSTGRRVLLALGSIMIIIIAGPLFAASIDNGSPADGFVTGFVIGFFVWLMFRSVHCGSWTAAWVVGLTVSTGVMVYSHYNLFSFLQDEIHGRMLRGDEGYEEAWKELSPGQTYRAWLTRELDEEGHVFLDHLRLMAQQGTVAWEKPFPYLAMQQVKREGTEVWWGWVGQIIWMMVTVTAGALIGVLFEEEERDKEKGN